MDLQKKLIKLSEYKCSFKYVDSYFLVSVTYPETWSVIESEDRSIEVGVEDGVTFYAAPIETNIEKAFELIDSTISYNLDVEKKVNLLKYNINKLQELFSEKDLEELETIEFVFKPKKTPKSVIVQTKKTKSTSKRGRKKVLQEFTDTFEPKATLIVDEQPQIFYGLVGNGDNCCEGSESFAIDSEPIQTENKYLEEVER